MELLENYQTVAEPRLFKTMGRRVGDEQIFVLSPLLYGSFYLSEVLTRIRTTQIKVFTQ